MRASRRQFLSAGAVLAGTAVLPVARADTLPRVQESDPAAQNLGYRDDASKVDRAKYTNYVAGSACNNCALYQGKPGDASGPCPMFPAKAVSAKGWCKVYTKKG